MTLTQLKRKTFTTATEMRKHKTWRPSLQVLSSPRGQSALGWWLVARKCFCPLTELDVVLGTCRLWGGDCMS